MAVPSPSFFERSYRETRSVKAKERLRHLLVDKTVLRVRELMEILVGIEAGVWTVEDAERLAASGNPSAA